IVFKLRRPKEAEWLAIKFFFTWSDPFSKAPAELGGQTDPTTPLVIPAISGILKWLRRKNGLLHTLLPLGIKVTRKKRCS
ncbi:hypothetical protein JG687_00005714, partial [Phytophthora cactorum]